ncbi:MAG: OsmC family protein [Flavobacteriaceae bacterium]|nr:OsmC family protein [Flavobacteriaceae bacterium]
MKITLNRLDDNFLFECKNENGQKILLNNIREEKNNGVSPMEAVLMSLAGCSGIDLVHILKKQRQNITHFSSEVEGERVEVGDAKPFKSILVKFFVEGEIEEEKAKRAVKLSFEKYCSVSKMLESSVEIKYEISVNGKKLN